MLGQDLNTAKDTLKKLWQAEMAPLGATAAEQELSVMALAAVWQAAQALQTQRAARRARLEEDPTKIPEPRRVQRQFVPYVLVVGKRFQRSRRVGGVGITLLR